MSGLSNYAANKLLDHVLGGPDFTRPATVYASNHSALLTAAGVGTEFSTGGYARKAITNDSTNFPAAASYTKKLRVVQEFALANAAQGTITDVGLWDASSSGNLLAFATLGRTRIVGDKHAASFAVDAWQLSIGGMWSSYLALKVLDHLLGGSDYVRPATVYLALAVAGVEVSGNNYSRKAVTNNATNFPAASSRSKALAVAHQFDAPSGNWGTVDEVRLYDASSAGNLLFSKALTTPKLITLNKPARFPAGALQFAA